MELDKYLETKLAYDMVAEGYATNAFSKHWMKGYVNEFCALLGKSGKLLDLGCGPGNDSALFVQQGFEVVGVDFSEKMLAEARKRVSKATFIRSDLRNTEFADEEFDAIWSVGSLHHLAKADASGVLKKNHQCLKTGGFMFISVQSGEYEGIITQKQIGDGKVTCKFWSYWRPTDLVRELEQVGFTVIKQTHTETMRKRELPEKRKDEQWINVWCRKF